LINSTSSLPIQNNTTSGAWNSGGTAGAWGGGGGGAAPNNGYDRPASGAVPAIATAGTTDSRKKEADLNRREAELNKREAELRRLELEIRNNPAMKSIKNWPKYCAVVHHDIAGEIPAENQGMVKTAYYAFLGFIFCAFYNIAFGTSAGLIEGKVGIGNWLWSALFLVAGVPGAFILWYMRLYNAAIKDGAFKYAVFFIFFLGHLIFVGWAAVGPPILAKWSLTGWWAAINMIDKNDAVGILYFIGAALWSLEFLWSFWTLKNVYTAFRGGGMSMTQARNEAARRAAGAV
jgi:hypothetical protein